MKINVICTVCCKQHCRCMIDVSVLHITCSVFLLNISCIRILIIIIIHSNIFTYDVLGLCVMEIISVGVLGLGVYWT